MATSDTIFALSSAPGESAIAVLRISGTAVEELVCKLFCRHHPLLPRKATLVTYYDRKGQVIDELLAVYFPPGGSFTGEAVLELYPHGNPLIVQSILEDLGSRDLRPAEPGEFTRRAFLNGRIDLSQAEAIGELIQARSERALAAAHRMLAGGLGERMSHLTEQLLGVIAHLEAYIDFPEEDLPPEDADGPIADLRGIENEIERLLATESYGHVLRSGVKAMILGAPNVGKSSLINALTGRRRAIVSEQAGTTRDIVSDDIMIDGHRIILLDTAGIRDERESIEAMGVDYAMDEAAQADFFLLVYDHDHLLPDFPPEIQQRMTAHNTLILSNKADLRQNSPEPPPPFDESFPQLSISALTGEGMQAMRDTWAAMLRKIFAHGETDGITVNARHALHLKRAREHVADALAKLASGDSGELAAAELRETLDQFAGVVGQIDNERMLDKLFQRFCIGK